MCAGVFLPVCVLFVYGPHVDKEMADLRDQKAEGVLSAVRRGHKAYLLKHKL